MQSRIKTYFACSNHASSTFLFRQLRRILLLRLRNGLRTNW